MTLLEWNPYHPVCSTWQAIYQGQTRYTRILDLKLFINTFNCILHRLESKYFLFTQFLLNGHKAGLSRSYISFRKMITENLKFRTGLEDQVLD